MGTDVQFKMFTLGYDSTKDLDDNSGNDSWVSYHENKGFGQYYSLSSAKPELDGYTRYDKEYLRQTILRHENTFRHQVHELHRLRKIQVDIMNEVQRKESPIYLHHKGTLQSNPFAFPPEGDKRRCHNSSLPLKALDCHMPSASGAHSVQSHFGSISMQIMQSGCGSIHEGSRLKDHVSLEYKHKKLQRRLFDLELPAEKYISDEEEGQGVSGGSGVKTYPPGSWNCEVRCEKNGSMPTHCSVYSTCVGDALSSNMHLRTTRGFTDLNESIQTDETSGTTSFDVLDKVAYSDKQIQRQDLSAKSCSGFQCLAPKVFQSPCKKKDNGNSPDSERGLPCNFNPGQTRTTTLGRSSHGECLPPLSESSHVGCRKAHVPDQNKPENLRKKTIFGVEISDKNYDANSMTSDVISQPPAPQSKEIKSESSSISSWKKTPSSLRQDAIFVQGNPCFNSLTESNKSSVTLMHFPEASMERSIVNGKVECLPSSGVELSYKNCLSPISYLQSKVHSSGHDDSRSAAEQVPQQSPQDKLRSSGWLANIKSAEEVNLNAVPPKCYQNLTISDSNLISLDNPWKEETPLGGLSWLRTISLCNGKSSNEMGVSHLVNLDSLERNCSGQFACNSETMKGDSLNFIQDSSSATNAHDAVDRRIGGDSSSNGKALDVPLFKKHMSKDLPPSASFDLKPSCGVSETNGANYIKGGLFHTDLNKDPMEFENVEMQQARSLNVEQQSVNCSANIRDPIDLNVSATEEEAQVTHCLPRTEAKIAIQIDLEAPAVCESEIDIMSGDEFLESKCKESFVSMTDESSDVHEGFLRAAAEALVVISSSGVQKFQDADDSLQWFADVICSHNGLIDDDVGSGSAHTSSTDCEDSIPDAIDFFEYMTLNLTETTVEVCNYESQVLENTKDEISLPRRHRRGQARRGRQRKYFQRDVLPGLISLSRNDVTEDLQMIEGLISATGGTWQSGLSQRNSPKGKGRRGRKRAADSASSPTVTAVSPPQTQQTKCGELGLEVTGWGKRTRRPPRQRYPINNPLPQQ